MTSAHTPGRSCSAAAANSRAASRTTWGSTDQSVSKRRDASDSARRPGRSQPTTQPGWSGASQIRIHSRSQGGVLGQSQPHRPRRGGRLLEPGDHHSGAGGPAQVGPPLLGRPEVLLLLEAGEQHRQLRPHAALVLDGPREGQHRRLAQGLHPQPGVAVPQAGVHGVVGGRLAAAGPLDGHRHRQPGGAVPQRLQDQLDVGVRVAPMTADRSSRAPARRTGAPSCATCRPARRCDEPAHRWTTPSSRRPRWLSPHVE